MYKRFFIFIMLLKFITMQTLYAGRFGGGRSRGMQRSYSQPSYNHNNNNMNRSQHASPPVQNNPQHAQPQRQGMGVGSGALLGAAAGAVGGYMLGKSMNQNGSQDMQANESNYNNQAAPQAITTNNTSPESQMPWGIIAVLALLLVFGLMFFRKKSQAGFSNFQNNNNNQSSNNNPANGKMNYSNLKQKVHNMTHGGNNTDNNNQPNQIIHEVKMPDGIETVYFLRQAKGMFLHIQSMNNADNVHEVEKYLSKDLYHEIKDDIANNSNIADFPILNCRLLDANIENNQLLASVEFSGTVSENPADKPENFIEVWNFVKPDIAINKWLVAGIQVASVNASVIH